MPNDSKQLSYLKRNAARSKDILLLVPNHVVAAAHDLQLYLSRNSGFSLTKPTTMILFKERGVESQT